MIRLRLLGGALLEVDGEAVVGAVVRRHPLAFLALLARAPSHQLSRDKLVGYLWPDTSPLNARHRLRDVVYRVRARLGSEAVRSVGDDLRLDAERIAVDVIKFESALGRSALTEAIALYHGPFLDGFFLNRSVNFERWVEAERVELAQSYRSALRRLADSAEEAERPREAAGWWHRLAREAPYDSDVALGLMRALAAAGDRVGALRHAESHAARLTEELGVPADERIRVLMREFELTSRRKSPERRPHPTPVRVSHEDGRGPRSVGVGTTGDTASSQPASRSRLWVTVGVLGVAIAAGLTATLTRSHEAVVDPTRVAVFPFTIRGQGVYSYLEDGLVDLLAVKLALPGETQTVDPMAVLKQTGPSQSPTDIASMARIAESLDAGNFVHGSIVQSDHEAHVVANLYSTSTARPVGVADVSLSEEASLFAAVDQLSRAILSSWLALEGDNLARVAGFTTTSLPAFKLYIAGERSMRRGRYGESVTRFTEATDLDPSFALAYYRLSVAANWAGLPDLVRSATESAWSLREGLPERARRLLQFRHGYYVTGSGPTESMRLLQTLIADYPADVEARYHYADLRFHNGWLWGLGDAEVRRDFERVLSYDPEHSGALVHLVRLVARQRDHRALDTLVERGLLLLEDERSRHELEAVAVFSRRSRSAQDRLLERLREMDANSLHPIAAVTATFSENFADASRLVGLFGQASRSPSERAYGLAWSAVLQAARGRLDTARSMLEARGPDPVNGAFAGLLIELSNPLSVNSPRLEYARDRLAALSSGTRPETGTPAWIARTTPENILLLLSLAAARLKDTVQAVRYADELERLRGLQSDPAAWAILPRAAVALWAGKAEDALRLLDEGWQPLPPLPATWQTYLRAESLRSMGADEQALRWYRTLPSDYVFAPLFTATYHLRSAALSRRMGRHSESEVHFQRTKELWDDADPPFHVLLREARFSGE